MNINESRSLFITFRHSCCSWTWLKRTTVPVDQGCGWKARGSWGHANHESDVWGFGQSLSAQCYNWPPHEEVCSSCTGVRWQVPSLLLLGWCHCRSHDVESAYEFYIKSKLHLLEVSFNLRKFATNSPELQGMINSNKGQQGEGTRIPGGDDRLSCNNPNPESNEQLVIGMRWNVDSDKLIFDSVMSVVW